MRQFGFYVNYKKRQVFKPHLRTFNPLWQIFCDKKASVDWHREYGGEHPFLLKERLCGIDILLSLFSGIIIAWRNGSCPEDSSICRAHSLDSLIPGDDNPFLILHMTDRILPQKYCCTNLIFSMVVRCGIDEFCLSNARWNLVRISEPQWVAWIGEPD